MSKILLSSPTMHGDEMAYIQEAFDKNWVAPLGFNCDGFENEMCDYLNQTTDHPFSALCLVSGTSALHLAVKLAGVKRDDIVLTSDMTFSATVNPISYEGARQVFIDSEYETWNMSPEALQKAFEKYPTAKVVMLAHLYGTPSKIDEIREICAYYGATLIEDAAEALSSTYKGRACGTFGKFNALSFNGNKIITTSGGGMLITEEKEARAKALFWATQSRENAPWYQHEEIGYNYRMSNIVAGIGRAQLKHLEEHRALKEKIYKRYEEGLAGLPVSMNPYLKDITRPNFWLSCMLLEKGVKLSFMDILNKLAENGMDGRPIWKPMHMQPVFSGYDSVSVGESVGEDIFSRGLCLPSDIKMTEEQQDSVIKVIKSCF